MSGRKNTPPSEVVQGFLDWLGMMTAEQEQAAAVFLAEDDRLLDFVHAIEFEADGKKRSVIDTQLHKSRVVRREAKDKATLLKPIRDFVNDASNKAFLKRLRRLKSDLESKEEYIDSDRKYKPRGKDPVGLDEHNAGGVNDCETIRQE